MSPWINGYALINVGPEALESLNTPRLCAISRQYSNVRKLMSVIAAITWRGKWHPRSNNYPHIQLVNTVYCKRDLRGMNGLDIHRSHSITMGVVRI